MGAIFSYNLPGTDAFCARVGARDEFAQWREPANVSLRTMVRVATAATDGMEEQ
jgi:hypothetical protein